MNAITTIDPVDCITNEICADPSREFQGAEDIAFFAVHCGVPLHKDIHMAKREIGTLLTNLVNHGRLESILRRGRGKGKGYRCPTDKLPRGP